MNRTFLIFFTIFSNLYFSQRYVEDKNLFIFIGEKKSVTEFDPNQNPIKSAERVYDEETSDTVTITRKSYVMDNAFKCKYVVVKNFKNNLPEKIVEFNTYDHYGRPSFEKFEYVLLYISKNPDGKYFHQKYIYDPVFKINNEWFGVLSFKFASDNLELWKKFKTKNFNKDNAIKYKLGFCDKKCQEKYYPKPYFEIKNGFVYPKKAFKIKDIIAYRKATTFSGVKQID